MSTTVTYKGNILTTVNNATKTLKTAGKYMEGNVILTDTTVDLSSDTVTPETLMQGYTAHDKSGATIIGTATEGSMIIRDTEDSHGGTVRTITAGSVITGTKSITENGTAIDVAQYASVDVAVEDSTFVVTLSYNESTEMWEPDCTYAEAYAAYQDGKDIVFVTTEYDEVNSPVFGEYVTIFNSFHYDVISPIIDGNGDIVGHTETIHFWDAQRAYVSGRNDEWYARDATAQPSQVAEGAVFYNANGKQVGTATPSTPTLQSKSVSYTPSETAQSATVTADSGYDGLSSVDVSVGAISSTYVGSGITQRSSTDLTASGATVTVPAGYYSAQASKAVASGTAGTPTATKETVSNHSVSVTPSVTNTTGYITGGTKSGTAVTVAASELVSGTLSITSSGTKDVTNYASASVAAGSATASATKGSVSNHSVTVTPTVTRTAGYVTAGTVNGTAVTVSASELVSGTLEVTESGTYDVTNYASADVSVSGGVTNFVQGTFTTSSTTGSKQTIDIPYTGTGYPIIAHVEVTGGVANENNTGWYDAIRRFSVGLWHMSKNNPNTGFKNYDTGAITARLKTSTTDASAGSFESTVSYYYAQPGGAGSLSTYDVVTFTSKTQLSVFVSASDTRGLMPGISYSYFIVYSE